MSGCRESGIVAGTAATQKVTITLSIASVETVRGLVESGQATFISGFVQHAVERPGRRRGLGASLSAALASTGGELSARERAWADAVLRQGERTGAA